MEHKEETIVEECRRIRDQLDAEEAKYTQANKNRQ